MHESASRHFQQFVNKYFTPEFLELRNDEPASFVVVEIGSADVNGSLRTALPDHISYVGIDFAEGPGVDFVLDDPYSFPLDDGFADVVITSSCFEHSEFFWLTFLESLRILKNDGLMYVNAPTNGYFHQWPVDCWRFFPDAGFALANWAKFNNQELVLLESFIGDYSQEPIDQGGAWRDFVAVFAMPENIFIDADVRMINDLSNPENGYTNLSSEIINMTPFAPDAGRLIDQKSIIGDLTEKKSLVEVQLDDANQKIHSFSQTVDDLQSQANDNSAINRDLSHTLSEQRQEIARLWDLLDEQTSIAGAKDQALEQMRLAIEESTSRLEQTKSERASIERQFELSSEERGLTQTQLEESRFKEGTLTALLDEARRTLSVKDKEIDDLTLAVERADVEIADNNADLLNLEAKHRSLEIQKKNSDSIINQMEARLVKAESALNKGLANNSDLSRLAREQKTQITSLNKRLLKEYDLKKINIEKIERAVAQISDMQLELDLAAQEKNHFARELAAKKDELNACVGTLEETEQTLRKVERKLKITSEEKEKIVNSYAAHRRVLENAVWQRDLIVEAIYASQSWKLTSPLRTTLTLFRRTFSKFKWRGRARSSINEEPAALPENSSNSFKQAAEPVNDVPVNTKHYFEHRVEEFSSQRLREVSVESPKIISAVEATLDENKLEFPLIDSPKVSIIIPVFNNVAMTLQCLTSIKMATTAEQFEIIVTDDCSSDESSRVLSNITGIRYLRNKSNLGFLKNCNKAAKRAKGEFFVFLNNDVLVTDDWLDELLAVLSSRQDAGAVGPKIVYPSGHLQEAGASLNSRGMSDMVGLNDSPDLPAYNFIRAVDYCSGAALMVSRALFQKVGGFSPVFAPAYCEDSDLCLKLKAVGFKTYYTPRALVVHRLSSTMNELPDDWKYKQINKNLGKFSEKWASEISLNNKVRKIAFYLPQFHRIPENDEWWGEGFTEWTNVKKAKPNFSGHSQPKIPRSLGYYNLDDPQILIKQAELAERYGIDGFCFYYYWFNGRRLLERPLERIIKDGSSPIPFCFCWANENWSRRWDGRAHDILMEQNYSEDDDIAVIADISRAFEVPQYISVDGRPLILVYKVDEFPDFQATAQRWRQYCREVGVGEIYICMVESHDLVFGGHTAEDFGCDAAVEFPPLNMAAQNTTQLKGMNADFRGGVGDYFETALKFCLRAAPNYIRFRGVMPGWDNTARKQNDSFIFTGESPEIFEAWLSHSIAKTRLEKSGDEQLIFINAWNEWAEGAYLEPDQENGHKYLEAVKNAEDVDHMSELPKPMIHGLEAQLDVSLVGHPFAPIGMGEHVRCSHRALKSVGLNARLRDIYGLQKPDDALVQEFGSSLSDGVGEINIFHINGDEVEQTMAHLTFNGPLTGYNIVYPAWELSQYPEAWAALLDSFDEIWAPSAFIEESLNKVCKKPVIHMPLATEVLLPQFIGREYFSISGDSFVFLFFFDLRSYATRKNPDGVISAIRKLAERRPNSDVTVVLKVLGGDTNPDELLLLEKSLAKVNFKKLFITEELSDCEVKNLVRSCDCFISLHRSEGYGRGIAEAMTSGKAVIATEYSGNMDYMSHETAKCVPFNLVPVLENQYPHWENQVWAEPDIEAAVNFMVEFLDAPDLAGKFGQRAQAHMRANFSYPAIGRLLLDRLMKIKTKNIGVGN